MVHLGPTLRGPLSASCSIRFQVQVEAFPIPVPPNPIRREFSETVSESRRPASAGGRLVVSVLGVLACSESVPFDHCARGVEQFSPSHPTIDRRIVGCNGGGAGIRELQAVLTGSKGC